MLKDIPLLRLALFSFLVRLSAQGLMPILPLFAHAKGFSYTLSGEFLSFSYFSLFAGTVLGGWLIRRGSRPWRVMMLGSMFMALAELCFTQVNSLWGLYSASFLFWLNFGILTVFITVLVGIRARRHQAAGRSFGLLETSSTAATVAGGLLIGPVIDARGFNYMFELLAFVTLAVVVLSVFMRSEVLIPATARLTRTERRKVLMQEKGLLLFLLASLISASCMFMNRMGTSTLMKDSGFSFSTIGESMALGTALSLPFPMLAGYFSDRYGKRTTILAGLLSLIISFLFLYKHAQLGYFQATIFFISLHSYAGKGMEPACLSETVSADRIGVILPVQSALLWVGGAIGFGLAGWIIQRFGYTVLCFSAIGALCVSTLLFAIYFNTRKSALAAE